jgi:hypothetical protein
VALLVADDFVFPVAAIRHNLIALGKTRAGKSSKLRVLAEYLLEGGAPVCIIDPKGDWWGLKSSADGKRAGFPIVIFGGEHADVPINEHSGAHVAEIIATGNRPALIDLGGWMVGARTRFFVDFAGTFFRLARGARHLVIDEVHNFAPQGRIMDPDAGKMLHWSNRLASEGSGKGITVYAASQRPQKVHKDFVTSCETLIACKVIHKLDRDAIKDWIDGCADATKGREVIADLAQLKKPEAWVWCPEVDFGPKRITFPLFRTYDSFKPQAADAGKLKGWADVDLEDVKAKLVSVVKEAEANDPRKLKAEIARLTKLISAPSNEAPKINTAALDARIATLERDNAELERNRDAALESLERVKSMVGAALASAVVPTYQKVTPPQRRIPDSSIPKGVIVHASVTKPRTNGHASTSSELGAGERKILAALAQHGPCNAGRLTLLSGYSYTGTFRTYLSSLRTAGLIEGKNTGTMSITDAGLAHGPFDELPTGEALRRHWLNFFGAGEGKILQALFDNPNGLDAQQLCALTDYEYTGTFRTYLSSLRTAGVLVGSNTGVMRVSDELLENA